MTHLISIHTPTRGVTWRSDYLDSWHRYFNPHSHKGSDARFNNNDDFIDISIHTPTRGVTRNVSFEDGAINDFNPHSHKGSDLLSNQDMHFLIYFNPHSHKGSDVCKFSKHGCCTISIHTPTRGVTIQSWPCYYKHDSFQSTLPQGEWPQYFTKTSLSFYKILTIYL